MASTSVTFDILARDKASQTFKNVGNSAAKSSSHVAKFGAVLKKSAIGIGLVTAAAGVFVAKVGAQYVDSLNQIQALTGANNKQMAAAAKALESNSGAYAKMGQSTGDAAAGVVELTKSGLSLKDALKSIHGTMVLAKAGALSVADASTVTANALNTFHLKAKDAGKVANYLANAANISSADVSDLAESLKYVSPVAASAGVSVKQTAAIMAELANAGIKGSQAGTSLRTFLLSLEAPSASAGKALGALNASIYDSTGKMKPLGDVIGILGKQLHGLTAEERNADLKAIFGKTGIAGATTILNEGNKGLAKYTQGVGKAGAASKLAQARTKGLGGSIAMIKASAISSAQSLYRNLSPIADRLIRPLAKDFADLSTKIGPGVAAGLKKVGDAIGKMHIADVGKKLAAQAKGWAAPVIDGFKQGLDTGDWSGLGKALGNGLIKAAAAMGDLTAKFGDLLAKVDWVGIGIMMGKQAPSLFLGLAAGILNFDIGGMLKGMGKHWQDILLGILALAFAPAKWIGKVAELLGRIPLAGKLLEWGFLAMAKFSKGTRDKAWEALKFLGRAFMDGFRKVFPTVGKAFTEALGILPTRLGLIAIDVAEKARSMMANLAKAIGAKIGDVVSKLGELTAKMLKPFAGAANWLYNAGRSIITGLINGLKSMFGPLQAALKWVTDKIPNWKGPPSKDKALLRQAGRDIMQGLVDSIDQGALNVKTALGRVTTLVQDMGTKISNLQGIKSGFANTFTADSIFGADMTQPGSGIDSLIAAQKKQAHQAHRLNKDIKQATKMGLSKDLIKQLQSQGTSGAAALHAIATGSQAQIRQLNALNKQTNQSLKSAGMRAGNYVRGGSVNADIRVAQKQEHVLELLEHHLKDLAHSEKKGQTIIVKIGDDAIIKAIHRYEQRTGKKT
jgi:TP901 family phage tail tape measure protein